MIKAAAIISTSALLLLSVAPANAGPCTDEINNLSKVMASRDAGTGPTVGAGSPQSSPTPPQAGATQEHPPTAIIGKEAEGRAASPDDVRRQTTGQPTAADQPQSSGKLMTASDALSRARMLDKQGNETECMAAVQQARQLLGSQ